MPDAEFDQYADDYVKTLNASVQFAGAGAEFYAAYKAADLRRVWNTRHAEADPRDIVDFGCGIGLGLRALADRFPQSTIIGLDPSETSIEIASGIRDENVRAHLLSDPWPDMCHNVDVVHSACVFHHIAHDEHVETLQRIREHLRPGGRLFIYEHNPFNPLTRHAVNTCPFDEDAVLITHSVMRQRMEDAGFVAVEVEHRLFLPQPLQRLHPVERLLKRLPLGGQYFVTGCRPNTDTPKAAARS